MTKTFISPPKMVLPHFYTFLRLFDRFCVIPKKKSKKMWRAYCTLERYLKKKQKQKKTVRFRPICQVDNSVGGCRGGGTHSEPIRAVVASQRRPTMI